MARRKHGRWRCEVCGVSSDDLTRYRKQIMCRPCMIGQDIRPILEDMVFRGHALADYRDTPGADQVSAGEFKRQINKALKKMGLAFDRRRAKEWAAECYRSRPASEIAPYPRGSES